MTITVNGNTYTINDKTDLQTMRECHWADWYAVRTANPDLLNMQFDLYMDELDRQDALDSTGTYGRLKEVTARIQHAIDHHTRMYLHDVKARDPRLVDQQYGKTRIEHKTSFAQWEYGQSADECWTKLFRRAKAGEIWSWDPFKDGYEIVMPLADLLVYLAEYNEAKGLKVWFHYVGIVTRNKGTDHEEPHVVNQLQLQPVTNSFKRYKYIADLVKSQHPEYEVKERG